MSTVQTNTMPAAEATKVIRTNGKFTLLSPDDVKMLPRPTWLIDDILPSTGLACIYGPSGVGKSFLCLDIAASVATGLEWFGYTTKQRSVTYVALEAQAGFSLRMEAWKNHRGIPFPRNVDFIFDPFSLVANDDAASLCQLINTWTDARLVIIDTLNRAAPGKDENSSVDMGKIIAASSKMQAATGGLVLLVHHSGKDVGRGPRGHSSFYAAMDSVIEVSLDGERIIWTLVKSKDGEDRICRAFNLGTIELGADESGKVWKSCVVVEVERGTVSPSKNEPKGTNQKVILQAFTQLILERRMLYSAQGQDWPDGIPIDEAINELKCQLGNSSPNHRQSRTKEAVERLVEMGYIVLKEDLLNLPASKSEQGASK